MYASQYNVLPLVTVIETVQKLEIVKYFTILLLCDAEATWGPHPRSPVHRPFWKCPQWTGAVVKTPQKTLPARQAVSPEEVLEVALLVTVRAHRTSAGRVFALGLQKPRTHWGKERLPGQLRDPDSQPHAAPLPAPQHTPELPGASLCTCLLLIAGGFAHPHDCRAEDGWSSEKQAAGALMNLELPEKTLEKSNRASQSRKDFPRLEIMFSTCTAKQASCNSMFAFESAAGLLSCLNRRPSALPVAAPRGRGGAAGLRNTALARIRSGPVFGQRLCETKRHGDWAHRTHTRTHLSAHARTHTRT